MGKLFDKRDFLRLLSSAAVAAPTAIVATKATRENGQGAKKESAKSETRRQARREIARGPRRDRCLARSQDQHRAAEFQ